MRVLLFHGYMLRGTGSNIYTANLARALAHLGHEVHLFCQDRQVRIEGVEIHNPDIHGLLPVYVKDPYEGFEVKAFPELTEREREVLDLIAQGHKNADIAARLVLSAKTVRNHVTNILSKLQVADRAEAIVRAREAGLG